MTSPQWHSHRPLSCLCCLGISNSRKHPSDYGISVSCGMLSLARAFEIDGAETTCLWISPSLLGKVEVFGTQVSGSIWWNLLWKHAIRSHLLPSKDHEPWVETASKITRMHTHKTTSAETSTAFQYWQKITFFFMNKALWKFIFPPLPLQFKNGLFVFPAVRRESFFRTIISRQKERDS